MKVGCPAIPKLSMVLGGALLSSPPSFSCGLSLGCRPPHPHDAACSQRSGVLGPSRPQQLRICLSGALNACLLPASGLLPRMRLPGAAHIPLAPGPSAVHSLCAGPSRVWAFAGPALQGCRTPDQAQVGNSLPAGAETGVGTLLSTEGIGSVEPGRERAEPAGKPPSSGGLGRSSFSPFPEADLLFGSPG